MDHEQFRALAITLHEAIADATEQAAKDRDAERRVRLWVADCAAYVLHIYEATEKSTEPRKAIIMARLYARAPRKFRKRDLRVAEMKAKHAARHEELTFGWTFAREAALIAASACTYFPELTANSAAFAIVGYGWNSDPMEAMATAKRWQLDRLEKWMSDDEPGDWALPKSNHSIG